MFEVSVETMAVDADNDGNVVIMNVVGGHMLPLAQAGKPVRFPTSIIHIPLNKESATQLADKLREAAEKLPDALPEDFTIASDLSTVEKEAEKLKRFTK